MADDPISPIQSSPFTPTPEQVAEHNIQALVEYVYVRTGNEVMNSALAKLDEALTITKSGLDVLSTLQELHNAIDVQEKSSFQFDFAHLGQPPLTLTIWDPTQTASVESFDASGTIYGLQQRIDGGFNAFATTATSIVLGNQSTYFDGTLWDGGALFKDGKEVRFIGDGDGYDVVATVVNGRDAYRIDVADVYEFPVNYLYILAYANNVTTFTNATVDGVSGITLGKIATQSTYLIDGNPVTVTNAASKTFSTAAVVSTTYTQFNSYQITLYGNFSTSVPIFSLVPVSFFPGIVNSIIGSSVAFTSNLVIKTDNSNIANWSVSNASFVSPYSVSSAVLANLTNFSVQKAILTKNLPYSTKALSQAGATPEEYHRLYLELGSSYFNRPIDPIWTVTVPGGDGHPSGKVEIVNNTQQEYIDFRDKMYNAQQILIKTIADLEPLSGDQDSSTLVAKLKIVLGEMPKPPLQATDQPGDFERIRDWVLDRYTTHGAANVTSAGLIQQHLSTAITAAESLNDSQKEAVRRYMFIFEEYYKSAAAILNKLTQIIEKMGQNISR